MKKALYLIALIGSAFAAQAQQDAMYTHYAFNTLAVNPAYAGTRDALTITALNRAQWVGFEGAPVTQSLTLHTPFANHKMGAGLSVIHDQTGPVSNTLVTVDVAYRLKVGEQSTLALGLKGGLNVFQPDFTTLPLEDADDPKFTGGVSRQLKPNIGFGAYYFQPRFYTGISVPKIVEHAFLGGTGVAQRHFFWIAGTVVDLSDRIALKPTTFLKVTPGAPLQLDVTTQMVFAQKFYAGLMLRTGDGYGVLAGVNLTDQLTMGYAFDVSATNPTFTYNLGSHEVLLRYDLVYRNAERIVSPRHF